MYFSRNPLDDHWVQDSDNMLVVVVGGLCSELDHVNVIKGVEEHSYLSNLTSNLCSVFVIFTGCNDNDLVIWWCLWHHQMIE